MKAIVNSHLLSLGLIEVHKEQTIDSNALS